MMWIVNSPECRNGIFSCALTTPAGDIDAYFMVPNEANERASDSFLVASLLLAMTTGAAVRVVEPVSERLLNAIPQIQDIFLTWNRHRWVRQPRLKRVKIQANAIPSSMLAPSGGLAAFFTAGVDSFYTALKHINEIDALIYVRGFDVNLSEETTRGAVITGIRRAAAGLGKPLIELSSNLRDICLRFIDWGPYHGEALASAATALAGRFRRIYVPSSWTYAQLEPWGSHPLLDPLWSTEEVEIAHDGCEASRMEKLQAIADNPLVRSSLRVCLENADGAYNCGCCEKCLRTMVGLRAIGQLESFSTFPDVDLGDMRFAYKPRISEWRRIWERMLVMVEESGKDPELATGIRRLLKKETRS